MTLVFLHLLRLVLCPNTCCIQKNVPCTLEKKVYSAVVGWSVVQFSWSIMYFKFSVSSLIFCLVLLLTYLLTKSSDCVKPLRSDARRQVTGCCVDPGRDVTWSREVTWWQMWLGLHWVQKILVERIIVKLLVYFDDKANRFYWFFGCWY